MNTHYATALFALLALTLTAACAQTDSADNFAAAEGNLVETATTYDLNGNAFEVQLTIDTSRTDAELIDFDTLVFSDDVHIALGDILDHIELVHLDDVVSQKRAWNPDWIELSFESVDPAVNPNDYTWRFDSDLSDTFDKVRDLEDDLQRIEDPIEGLMAEPEVLTYTNKPEPVTQTQSGEQHKIDFKARDHRRESMPTPIKTIRE